jgi:hypothetical protein
MKVGILIKKPENIFSNGCVQQSLFLKKIIKNTGFSVDFLSIEASYTHFELTSEEIVFTDENFDFSNYFCIILASLVLLPNNNQAYIENLLKYNTCIINLVCGNLFILNQEEFVFDVHKILNHYTLPYFTLNWVLEMYDHSRDYIQLLTSKHTEITPYVWDPDIIAEYLKIHDISINKTKKDNSKINILIFEPNMSIHKNALVPLLICEDYNKKFPNCLNKVYLFCSSNISDSKLSFLKTLSIYKHIEVHGRIIMPYIINVIEKNNNFMNIVLSYTLLNNLNFLHLEFFYLGIPIVHNCEPFQHNGLFFESSNSTKASLLIEHSRTDFNQTDYNNNVSKILMEFSSKNTKRIEHYKTCLQTILCQFEINNNPDWGFCLTIPHNMNTTDIIDYILKLKSNYNNPNIEVYHSTDVEIHELKSMDLKILRVEQPTKEKVLYASSFKKIFFSNNLSGYDFEIYTK